MSELKSQGKNKIAIPSVDIPDIDSLYKNEKDESKERFKSTLLYVPEGRKKLNKDLVKRQYFHNFIAPLSLFYYQHTRVSYVSSHHQVEF